MIGFAGHQGKEYLPIVQESADIVGGVDSAPPAVPLADEWGFPYYGSLDDAMKSVEFDAAVVTVPHGEHFPVCTRLLAHGRHVIKEKPFAVTEPEARQLIRLAQQADRSVFTLLQRNFDPVFRFARDNLARIGRPYWFSYDYHFNLARPTTGWRASREQARGGVLLDMGYHLVDVLNGMFPEAPGCTRPSCTSTRRRGTADWRIWSPSCAATRRGGWRARCASRATASRRPNSSACSVRKAR